MSPSWRDRFEILIRPGEVVARRLSRGLRPTEEIVVRNGANGDTDLASLLAAALDELPARRSFGSIARVHLSDSLCRHALVPWSPNIRGEAERRSLRRACFEELYGDATTDWQMTSDRRAFGIATPAFAAESGLTNCIATKLSERRIRLQSLAPLFSAVFNRYRSQFMRSAAVLGVFDSRWSTIATFRGGEWNSLRSVRTPQDGAEKVRLLTREGILQRLTSPDIFACGLDKASSPGIDVEELSPWGTIAQPLPLAALLPGRWPT